MISYSELSLSRQPLLGQGSCQTGGHLSRTWLEWQFLVTLCSSRPWLILTETTCGVDKKSWNVLRSLHHLWGGQEGTHGGKYFPTVYKELFGPWVSSYFHPQPSVLLKPEDGAKGCLTTRKQRGSWSTYPHSMSRIAP